MKHIAFSYVGGQALKVGFSSISSVSSVLVLEDSLTLGPIDEPWSSERKDYIKKLFVKIPKHPDTWECFQEKSIVSFWDQVLNSNTKTVWMSSRSASDWCGLMMLLAHTPAYADIYIIDVSEHFQDRPIINLAELDYSQLLPLRNKAIPIHSVFRTALLFHWNYLKEQSKHYPIRFLDEGKLTPQTWDVIDKALLMVLSFEGKVKMSNLLGGVLNMFASQSFDQLPAYAIEYRIQELIFQSKIQIEEKEQLLNFNSLLYTLAS